MAPVRAVIAGAGEEVLDWPPQPEPSMNRALLRCIIVADEVRVPIASDVAQALVDQGLRVEIVPFSQVEEAGQAQLWILCAAMATLPWAVAQLRAADPSCAILVVASLGEEAGMDPLFEMGVNDFLLSPLRPGELVSRCIRALGLTNGMSEPVFSRSSGAERGLTSGNIRVNAALARAPRIAASRNPTVIFGERGSGRASYARLLTRLGRVETLAEVSCAHHSHEDFPQRLEAAVAQARESAAGGAVLLHDIDSLSVGARRDVLHCSYASRSRVRFLATALPRLNGGASLWAARILGSGSIHIELPALRERREDILLLSNRLLRELNADADRPKSLSPAAVAWLLAQDWPGNIAELRATLAGAISASGERDLIGVSDLDGAAGTRADRSVSFQQVKSKMLERFEKDFLQQMLASCRGNINEAARVTGKNRRALFALIRRHEIDVDRYREGPVFELTGVGRPSD